MNDLQSPDVPLILLIEDQASMRLQLRTYLEAAGYRVEEAIDGQAGIEAYIRLLPDIVLLDAVMPIMDGFTCCSQLLALPIAHPAPILMITGLEDTTSVDRAFAAGAIDFITKPIHWPVLHQRIRRLLQQVQLHRQLEAMNAALAQTNQELESANAALAKLAAIDSLTNLANRRIFDDRLNWEWRRLTRKQLPLSLILADIDFFKRYNDTYGHQAGDACLQQVAGVLQSSLMRPADLAARYGGEEFAIVLPNTNLAGAARVAERIRQQIRALAIPHAQTDGGYVSLSTGVACLIPQPTLQPIALLQAADQALYAAKAAGRDRIVTVSPTQSAMGGAMPTTDPEIVR
ncbi:PleD family two-component system response regulator [Microcoleus sp. FACHB-1515]|uniref:response regulator n=1 Tax=Cyanophyceae TaxID=3028117 RepID=UPI0016847242|nr:PleD family two-component system response regulator [Microcoleus sp. FACHB-1515]MBD2092111.1 PleD family two-component system response regulator [Microcoleus sp. FACHB-1515]